MSEQLFDGLTVAGMDPASYRNYGWGVVRYEGGKLVLLEKFTQVVEGGEFDYGRYRALYDCFSDLITKHAISVFCSERSMGGGLAFVRNNLSEATGVMKLCCHDRGIKVVEVSPAHVKKVFAGHGRAKKTHVKANVVAYYGLQKKGSEHECDAVACATCYFADLGFPYAAKVPCV